MMKHYRNLILLTLVLFTALFSGCSGSSSGDEAITTDLVHNPNSASAADAGALPVIRFDAMEYDFGRILEGETVAYDFSFTNEGKTDLILAEVTTSCGCTVPSYPKTPIRPGEKGTIKVTFNSQGRRGFQTKNILVVSNTQPNTTILKIKAQVVNAASEQ